MWMIHQTNYNYDRHACSGFKNILDGLVTFDVSALSDYKALEEGMNIRGEIHLYDKIEK